MRNIWDLEGFGWPRFGCLIREEVRDLALPWVHWWQRKNIRDQDDKDLGESINLGWL